MTTAAPAGRIITFYSYKGGTGRSMALANVAWILASCGKRVLAIDWDLEAPGLHRYFHPFLRDKDLANTEGLMDFVVNYVSEAMTPPPAGSDPLPPDWYTKHADIIDYAAALRWSQFEKPGTIDFVPAGRQCETYASTVNLFNWSQFYDKLGGGAFFEAAKDYMRREYDYILIDSRTGVSDTSGICTIQMPDIVVVCFTLNIQSIEGASAAAEAIDRNRRATGKEIRVFPVPTRVERSEKEKVDLARIEAWRKFEPYLFHLSEKKQADYWGAVELPYEPWYAFEEVLATFGDRSGTQASILSSLENLTSYITDGEVQRLTPVTETERKSVLATFLRRREEPEKAVVNAATRGEQMMSRLTVVEQEQTLSAILRLVRIPAVDEAGKATRRRLPRAQLEGIPDRVFQGLLFGRIINIVRDENDKDVVQLADDDVIEGWSRVKRAMDADAPFLRWHQQFAEVAAAWNASSGRQALLTGSRLADAIEYLRARPRSFSVSERAFIAAGVERRRHGRFWAAIAAVVPLLILLVFVLRSRTDNYQLDRIYATAPAAPNDASPQGSEALRSWIAALARSGRAAQAGVLAGDVTDHGRRALAYASLAAALAGSEKRKEMLAAIDAAQEAANRVAAGEERASVLTDVAAILKDALPDSAGGLFRDALRTAPATTERRAASAAMDVRLVSLPSGRPFDAGATEDTRRCLLFSRIATELQSLGLANEADPAFDAALRSLNQLPPAARVNVGLSLFTMFGRAGKEDGAKAALSAALLAIPKTGSDARLALLVSTAVTLTSAGRTASYQTLLRTVSLPEFLPEERSAVVRIVTRALLRSPYAAPSDPLWPALIEDANTVRPEAQAEAQAYVAAAFGAAQEADRARQLIDSAQRRHLRDVPRERLPRALAALAEAGFQTSDPAARAEWDGAHALALAVGGADNFAALAITGAACRIPNTPFDLYEKIDVAAVRQETAPVLMGIYGDSLRASSNPAARRDFASAVVVHTHGLDDVVRDPILRDATKVLMASSAGTEAASVAGHITDSVTRAETIIMILGPMNPNEALQVAANMADPFVRARALIAVAGNALPKSANVAANARSQAEEAAAKIETEVTRSSQRAEIAIAYGAAGDLRAARRVANDCELNYDRLRAYASIVDQVAQRSKKPV